MTDAALATDDTRALVQRRLIGLVIILLAAFLLSLLLRVRPDAATVLPTVVIPLNASSAISDPAAETASVPVLGNPAPRNDQPAAPSQSGADLAPDRSTNAKPSIKPAIEKLAGASKPTPATPPKSATAKPPERTVTAVAKTASAPTRWFVAVGAYKDPMAAEAIVGRIKLAGLSAGTNAVTSAGERLHRVRAGPFASKADAEAARATLIVEGMTRAVIVSEN